MLTWLFVLHRKLLGLYISRHLFSVLHNSIFSIVGLLLTFDLDAVGISRSFHSNLAPAVILAPSGVNVVDTWKFDRNAQLDSPKFHALILFLIIVRIAAWIAESWVSSWLIIKFASTTPGGYEACNHFYNTWAPRFTTSGIQDGNFEVIWPEKNFHVSILFGCPAGGSSTRCSLSETCRWHLQTQYITPFIMKLMQHTFLGILASLASVFAIPLVAKTHSSDCSAAEFGSSDLQ